MQEVWDTAKPEWLIWVAVQPDVLTDKELRLFAVFAARQVQHLMTDSRSIAALDVAESELPDRGRGATAGGVADGRRRGSPASRHRA